MSRHLEPALRRAHLYKCRDCGAPILKGLDNDKLAFSATTEIAPITRAGEITAILNRHRTYDLINGSLYYREPPHLKTWPTTDVVRTHDCAKPLDPTHTKRAARPTTQTTTEPTW